MSRRPKACSSHTPRFLGAEDGRFLHHRRRRLGRRWQVDHARILKALLSALDQHAKKSNSVTTDGFLCPTKRWSAWADEQEAAFLKAMTTRRCCAFSPM